MAIRERATGRIVGKEATECRACGCKDIRVVAGMKRCRHCGRPCVARRIIREEPEPVEDVEPTTPEAVIYHTIKCPECRSKRTKITSTVRPIRRHKCKDCEHTFKSVEQ